MELQFEKRSLTCLYPAVEQVQNQEQTQELRLAEGMPDIGRILGAWGQPILRGKQWQADSISGSGGMMVWVLYAPEDGSREQVLESWIPFQMRWGIPEDLHEGAMRMSCRVRAVDARSVSARKILIRAGMAAQVEGFVPMTAQLSGIPGELEGVELLKTSYPVRLTREAGEKTFLLDEEVTLPEGAGEKLIYYTLQPKITDKKVMSGKVVFRGTGNLHVLYRGEDDRLHSWDAELPFSQFDALSEEPGTDAQADLVPCVISLEVEPGQDRQLRIKCGLVCQWRVTCRELLETVEDAYSPNRTLQLQQQELELPVVLEQRRENLYGEQTIPAQVDTCVDLSFQGDYPRQTRGGDGAQLEGNGVIQALYYGEDGSLQSAAARWESRKKVEADRDTALWITAQSPENLSAEPGAGGTTVKMELPVSLTATARQRFPMVTGLELGEVQPPDPERPSLILRRAGADRLWDIAKESGSTVDAIRKANRLEADPEPEQMLLIPVS